MTADTQHCNIDFGRRKRCGVVRVFRQQTVTGLTRYPRVRLCSSLRAPRCGRSRKPGVRRKPPVFRQPRQWPRPGSDPTVQSCAGQKVRAPPGTTGSPTKKTPAMRKRCPESLKFAISVIANNGCDGRSACRTMPFHRAGRKGHQVLG